MYVMLYTILVMAYVCIQCHAFRRINHRSIMSISTINNKGILSRFSHHKINTQLILIYTIRGGSDEYNNNDEDENQFNNDIEQYDDEYIEDFISSFEAEMANIRRECCELLERIEDDVEAAELDIDAGHDELVKVYGMTKGNRGLILKVFGILIFLIIFMMVLNNMMMCI